MKNTIRDEGSTTLKTTFTVSPFQSVDTVYTVYTVFTFDTIQTVLHGLNSSM